MTNKARFTVEDILRATGGTFINGDKQVEICGVSTDTRSIEKGNLFVAFSGDNFNGSNFIGSAVEKGASCVVGSSSLKQEDNRHSAAFILVDDTLNAYQEIARFHRNRFKPKVVGITGTNGKSTTKEMAASVTGACYRTLKNEGNFNNHIGLPMTLLNLTGRDEVVVLEMGMRGEGDIRRLCEIARPDIGVVTNIGLAHLERIGSVSAISRAKRELIEALDQDGTAVLNADDPEMTSFCDGFKGRLISFGIEKDADVMANGITRKECGYSFEIVVGEESASVSLPCLGSHDILNALAAAAVGIALEIDIAELISGIGSYRPLPMRMETVTAGNITFVNDAYNANPESMRMAIRTLSGFNTPGKKILVAGDMLELGDKSEQSHIEMGKMVAGGGIDIFCAFGDMSSFSAKGAINNGMSSEHVFRCKEHSEAILMINRELEEGDCVMVKGSRGMRMEKIIDGLKRMRAVS